jgi:hypothetical protein
VERATEFLPSGLPSLDRFLGGGWPKGRLVELSGNPGGGKTSLALRAAAEVTRDGRWAAYVDRGRTLFPPAVERNGVDLSRFLWVRPGDEAHCRWAAAELAQSGLFPLIVTGEVFYHEQEARRLQLAVEKSGATAFLLTLPERRANLWAVSLHLDVRRGPASSLRLNVHRSRQPLSHLHLEVSLHEPENSGDPVPDLPLRHVAS